MRPAALLAALCFTLPTAAEEAKTYDIRPKYTTGATWNLEWEYALEAPGGTSRMVATGSATLKVIKTKAGNLRELEVRFGVEEFRIELPNMGAKRERGELSNRVVQLKRRPNGAFDVTSPGAALGDCDRRSILDTLVRGFTPPPVRMHGGWSLGPDDATTCELFGVGAIDELTFRLDAVDKGKEGTLATVSVWCNMGKMKLEGVMLMDVETGARRSLRLGGEFEHGKVRYVLMESRPTVPPAEPKGASEEEAEPEPAPDEPPPAPTPYKSPRGGFYLDIPEGWADAEIADGMGVLLTQRAAHATVDVRTHKVARGTKAGRFFKATLMPRLEGQGARIESEGLQKVGGHAGYGARYSGDGTSGWIVVVVAGARAWSFHSRVPTNAIELVMPEVREIAASLRLPAGEG